MAIESCVLCSDGLASRLAEAGAALDSRLAAAEGEAAPAETVEVYAGGERHPAGIYHRTDLRAGQHFQGPAVVAQDDCTTCILDGFAASVDGYGNLILEMEA